MYYPNKVIIAFAIFFIICGKEGYDAIAYDELKRVVGKINRRNGTCEFFVQVKNPDGTVGPAYEACIPPIPATDNLGSAPYYEKICQEASDQYVALYYKKKQVLTIKRNDLKTKCNRQDVIPEAKMEDWGQLLWGDS